MLFLRSERLSFIAIAALPVLVLYGLVRGRESLQQLFLNETRRSDAVSSVVATAQDFLTLTLGIVVEALPFVVLGVLFSVAIQVVLPTHKLIKKLPKNRYARRMIVSCLGVAMPVCECGNVPVARSLMIKGFTPQEAMVFLLAAPSVNIVTFIVTMEAFNFNRSVAIARVVVTLIAANATAWFVIRRVGEKRLLNKTFAQTCKTEHAAPRSVGRALSLFRNEMWLITRLLVIGAMIAAASQTFVPREVITAIGSNLVLSILAMLLLAFVVSICSSVDAFFALAYVNSFGLGPVLAFLVAGPMVDIKMIAMMRTTYTARTLVAISGSVLVLSFTAGLVMSYVW